MRERETRGSKPEGVDGKGKHERRTASGSRLIVARGDPDTRDAERAADRLVRLHAAALALADASGSDAAYTVVARHARVALGARHVVLALADGSDGSLTIARAAGFAPGELDDWRLIPRDARFPLAEAARTREAVYIEAAEAALVRFPDMAAMLAVTKARSCVAVPLEHQDALLGVLGLCFAAPRAFSDADRSFFALFARECAAAIERAAALVAERRARARAESAARASELLALASSALSQSLDSTSTLERIARVVVPHLADGCAIHLPDEHGWLARAAVAHVDAERERRLRSDAREPAIEPRAMHPIAHVMRTGEPQIATSVGAEARAALARGPFGDAITSYMIVPLVARARTLGTMMLVADRRPGGYRRADLALAEDLAARAAMALDNARLYEDARRAVRQRDDLLAIVSHDLKNPLGVIQTTAQLMQRAVPSGTDEPFPKFRTHCDAIRRASDRMTRLIADLVDLASLQAGRLSIELGVHDAAAIVDEVAIAMRPIAAQHEIEVRVATSEHGRSRVRCDHARIAQVLGNLVGNAVKFAPRGGTITIACEAVEAPFGPGDLARFSVTDDGPGIDPAHLPHVFDRYWQAKATARLGTGLGLSIAKGIVEAHGGSIGVESEPGEGACFYFTLPLAPLPATSAPIVDV